MVFDDLVAPPRQHMLLQLGAAPTSERDARQWLARLPVAAPDEYEVVDLSGMADDTALPVTPRYLAPDPHRHQPIAAAVAAAARSHPEHAATLIALARTRTELLSAGHTSVDPLLRKLRDTQRQVDELAVQRDQLADSYELLRSRWAVRAVLLLAGLLRRTQRAFRRIGRFVVSGPRRAARLAGRMARRGVGAAARLVRPAPTPPVCPSCSAPLTPDGVHGSDTMVAGVRPAGNKGSASGRPDPHAAAAGTWVDQARPLGGDDPVTVIVPVYKAADHTRRCVESVLDHTDVPFRLLVIDDGSNDPQVDLLLAELEGDRRVSVLVNDRNLGFTGTVNRGMGQATGDVVLLNSDTQLGPGWLRNLWQAAYSAPDVASATALSDNAGAFSAPKPGQENPLPAYLDSVDAARLVSQHAARSYPTTPTANGFCVYLRRDALEAVGLFDAEAFPRGYGEENDWSMRAGAAGWRHVVDDATYVLHARSASFGEEKQTLIAQGRKVVDERWPDYTAAARTFQLSGDLAAARDRVATALASGPPKRRVLYVMHKGGGGTPQTNADLMRQLADRHDVEPFLSVTEPHRLELHRLTDGRLEQLADVPLSPPIRMGDTTHPTYRKAFARFLSEQAIDVVHIRQLVKQPLHDIVELTKSLELPLVVSLHDFYLACPTIQLLDENGKFCNAECTTGAGPCPLTMKWLQDGPPQFTANLKHEGVQKWRQLTGKVLAAADVLITTSPTARDLYQRVFATETAGTPFHVIPHGRDLEDVGPLSVPPTPGKPLRILVPGNLTVPKGAEILEKLKRRDVDGRLELHLLGKVPPQWRHLGVDHGTYSRGEFAARVAEIKPHVSAILSPWPETYSHTLSESWSVGVPVVATNLGALGERIGESGGGWLVEPDDIDGIYRQLVSIADDPDGWRQVQAGATASHLRSEAAMAGDYAKVYQQVAGA